ncbi:hypothetical protein Plhal304r1_c006g0024441 [Plasmopara halstedii]
MVGFKQSASTAVSRCLVYAHHRPYQRLQRVVNSLHGFAHVQLSIYSALNIVLITVFYSFDGRFWLKCLPVMEAAYFTII